METTENKILAAAEAEFMQKGFAGAKTVSIAEKAGVTHAMLHYYFRTKERLFQQVYAKKIGEFGNSLLAALATPGQTLPQRLRTGVGLHFDFLAANPNLPRFVINEMVANPANHALVREHLSPIVAQLATKMQPEADALAERGDICRVRMTDILLDIASLNAFIFITMPALELVVPDVGGNMAAFLARRREENIETIMRRLAPKVEMPV